MFTTVLPSRATGFGGSGSAAPSTQASSLTFLGIGTVRLTRGNGARILIVAKSGGAVDAHPSDNTSYTAGAFGSGTQIGTGNYVVYNGTDSGTASFIITGLSYGVSYGIRAYEFNGLAGAETYNIASATGNPITGTTPAAETWYLYHDAILGIRRAYNIAATSRATTQNYPTCLFGNATKFIGMSISEGEDGQDRTIRINRLKSDADPISKKSDWTYDAADSAGDPPAIIDGTNRGYDLWVISTTYSSGQRVRWGVSAVYESIGNGNVGNTPSSSPSQWSTVTATWDQYQCWAMGAINTSGSNWRLYYCANSGSAQDYGVGFMESSDDGETWTRYASNPVLAKAAGRSLYYFHPNKDGSTYYAFAQNYYASQLVEGHLYLCEVWSSSDGISWTKISGNGDALSGRGLYGAVDISQWWKEGSEYCAYISVNDTDVTGGFVSNEAGKLTTNPVGKIIKEIRWTDFANFNSNFWIHRTVFTNSQAVDIESRTWCAPLTHGGYKFVLHTSFQYRCQTLLSNQNEPYICGKILTTHQITDQGYTFVGQEAYPSFVSRLILPHQNNLNDTIGGTPVQGKEVLASRALTIVGTPLIARLQSIKPNGAGFVQDTAITYSDYLAIKIAIGRNDLSSAYGICGMDTDVGGGTRGWRIVKSSQYNIDVYLYGSNSTYKQYRLGYVPFIFADSSQFSYVGFIWANGSLKLCFDTTSDCETADASRVTKVRDDSFTSIQQTAEPFRIGAVYPTTNDPLYSQDVVGRCLVMVGSSNATETNWLNNELI